MAVKPTRRRLAVFDCDSTLSAIEGVDELAGFRSPDVRQQVAALTDLAMQGEIAIDEIFTRRMELIRPSREECEAIGQRYVETVEPTARQTLEALRAQGWTTVIVSGGFVPAIEPLARMLGIERIEAVPLTFEGDGGYAGFGQEYPTTRNGGKTEIVESLKQEYEAEACVMVGDGVSDLEVKPVVDLFVGFGRYAVRDRVRREAGAFIHSLDQLPALLARL